MELGIGHVFSSQQRHHDVTPKHSNAGLLQLYQQHDKTTTSTANDNSIQPRPKTTSMFQQQTKTLCFSVFTTVSDTGLHHLCRPMILLMS